MRSRELRDILGIDIGASGIKGAPVDTQKGRLIEERHRITTPQPATPERIAETVTALVRHFGWQSTIGIGFPAVVQQGIVRTASNIDRSWIGCDARALFSDATGCDVQVVNDADAAGLAEMLFGAGRNQRGVALVITIGTGLGTAIISDGVLVPNTELGHITLHGMAAEKYAADSVRKKDDLSWPEWGRRFNEYLQEMEKLIWPDLIILGGGASKKLHKFSAQLDVRAEVVAAELRNEAGLVGAAARAGLYHAPDGTVQKTKT